jgi:hypothetical protein
VQTVLDFKYWTSVQCRLYYWSRDSYDCRKWKLKVDKQMEEKKELNDKVYLEKTKWCYRVSKQVGAIIVRDRMIISDAW